MKGETAGNRARKVYGTLSANEALFAFPQPQVLTEWEEIYLARGLAQRARSVRI